MTIPEEISGSTIEAALLELAAIEDAEYYLHPEHLVYGVSNGYAQCWSVQRVAERTILLDEANRVSGCNRAE